MSLLILQTNSIKRSLMITLLEQQKDVVERVQNLELDDCVCWSVMFKPKRDRTWWRVSGWNGTSSAKCHNGNCIMVCSIRISRKNDLRKTQSTLSSGYRRWGILKTKWPMGEEFRKERGHGQVIKDLKLKLPPVLQSNTFPYK